MVYFTNNIKINDRFVFDVTDLDVRENNHVYKVKSIVKSTAKNTFVKNQKDAVKNTDLIIIALDRDMVAPDDNLETRVAESATIYKAGPQEDMYGYDMRLHEPYSDVVLLADTENYEVNVFYNNEEVDDTTFSIEASLENIEEECWDQYFEFTTIGRHRFSIKNLQTYSDGKLIVKITWTNSPGGLFELEKTYEFYSLGIGDPFICSAENSKGVGDILDECVAHFSNKISPEEDAQKIKVAVVGKPNAGKSSIINKLLGENRVMVSNVAGTTRDAIDSPFKYNGKDYLLIDTAGIRRKRSVESESVELYSVLRAFDAIRRADVVVMVVDATAGLSEQDVRIAGFIHEEGKPSVVVMNKLDLIEKDSYSMNKFNDQLNEDLKFMSYFVPLYTSAVTGQRLNKIMETVETVPATTPADTGANDVTHKGTYTVSDEEILKERFDLSVIGVVPFTENHSKHRVAVTKL